MKEKFNKGDTVQVYVHFVMVTPGEIKKVLRVDKRGVWLDNGYGNDPSGPFVNGRHDLPPLGYQTIKKVVNYK